jgi:Family of unknown function (DUF6113)
MPRALSAGSRLPAVWALAALGGFALGVFGSFLQAVHQLGVPVGTVIVLAATGLAFFGAGSTCRSRGVAAACAVGWALAVLLMITPRAAGDVVLTAAPRTYVFLAGGLLLGCAAGCWPYGVLSRGDPGADPVAPGSEAPDGASLRGRTR